MRYGLRTRARRALLALTIVLTLGALVAGADASAREHAVPPQAGAARQARATQAASRYARTISDGRVVGRQSFGCVDAATRIAPTADTMYGLGSVSKMLAAAATIEPVDEGKVELDAPFVQYAPAFAMLSPAYRQITVRMLLDHSPGLPGSTYADLATSTCFPGYLQQVLAPSPASASRPPPAT